MRYDPLYPPNLPGMPGMFPEPDPNTNLFQKFGDPSNFNKGNLNQQNLIFSTDFREISKIIH